MEPIKVPLKSILAAFGGDASRLSGLRVRAIHSPERDREYGERYRPARAAHNGQIGEIIYHHDSHGLCFHVGHGGAFATWELDELHVELTIEAP